MIELAFSLFDYFIKLVEKKEGNLDEYFSVYVQPAYEISEKVFSDYLNLLHSVKKKIQKGSTKGEVIEFLAEGRLKYLPIRRQLYAEVENRFDNFKSANLPKFEKGILGILMGGLSPFMTGHRYRTPYHSGHTLLDLLMRLHGDDIGMAEDFSKYNKIFNYKIDKSEKESYLHLVDEQIQAIEYAWQDVVEGYAEYKSMVAVKPSRIRKLETEAIKNKLVRRKIEGK